MQKKNNRGITLVSLMVTVVILIILTSITLVATVGDNGLITVLKQGRENVIDELENQRTKLNELEEENNNMGITTQKREEINNLSRDDTGVNSPVLGNGMIPVKNDGVNWVICSTDDKEWFDYTMQTGSTENGGTSRWANVMLSDGKYKSEESAKIGTIIQDNELGSMFVWIPRYAYKITYYTDSNKTTISTNPTAYGNIDIEFIKGNENISWSGIECKYADYNEITQTDYIVHPAFTQDRDFGGGFGELSGLWIGKFESSRSDSNATSIGTSEIIRVVPNVTSWRNTDISKMYTAAKEYNKNLNSHMLKNSEWGAVAYISYSKYGRNQTEIAVNQCGNYITGAGPGVGMSNVYNETYSYDEGSFKSTYSYNTSQGKKASTTGNVYGIYDMSGGVSELVASYYNNSDKLVNGESFADKGEKSNEYTTSYTKIDIDNAYIRGDATYETKKFNLDNASFVNAEEPFFEHGGYYIGMDNAGVFSFKGNDGNSSNYTGFRICLIVK